ncbi:hypothetical protein [Labilithrix luteola]|uniref:hypothetical protein n=1 Tax=Labilithrix luteola TaxID=1391654 RepID=UPI0011BA4E5B|nr:hypothetical protein [Labilithrix luteola]
MRALPEPQTSSSQLTSGTLAALTGPDHEGTWEVLGDGAGHVEPMDDATMTVDAIWIRSNGSEFATGITIEARTRLHAMHPTSVSEAWLLPAEP